MQARSGLNKVQTYQWQRYFESLKQEVEEALRSKHLVPPQMWMIQPCGRRPQEEEETGSPVPRTQQENED